MREIKLLQKAGHLAIIMFYADDLALIVDENAKDRATQSVKYSLYKNFSQHNHDKYKELNINLDGTNGNETGTYLGLKIHENIQESLSLNAYALSEAASKCYRSKLTPQCFVELQDEYQYSTIRSHISVLFTLPYTKDHRSFTHYAQAIIKYANKTGRMSGDTKVYDQNPLNVLMCMHDHIKIFD